MKEMMKEMVGGCCVCSDERGWPDNPLVYCDGNGCSVAVHQACYGIIAVPIGPWYCRKCETPEVKGKVRCELCPSKSGALKHTDTDGWAHVVCALYIPEVRFGNVTSMEPIVLRLVPPERYNKTCYICQDQGKTHRANAGACMQCNKSGCKQQFHVTCAQSLGLLCEEAGNYLDNVKYCGYCQHHYGKLKKGGNVKTIPPYKPVTGNDSHSSDSSEKDEEVSPVATGSATPTNSKTKGPGRKTNNNLAGSSKNSPNNKLPNNTPMEKKKPSPSRRGSSAGDGGSNSKTNTPAPSPQHNSDAQPQSKGSGRSTPNNTAKIPLPPSSPKQAETGSVISSVASIPVPPAPSPTTTATTTVVQAPAPKPVYQESVITNTEAVDTKQTKKRKAVSSAPAAPIDYAPPTPVSPPVQAQHCEPPPQTNTSWENNNSINTDVNMEPVEKVIKKAKTEIVEPVIQPGPFSCLSPVPPPPPPPPAHSPASHPSPRHLPSPMPGPSGLNQMSHIRSPSHIQFVKMRESPVSLLVSVPLPPVAHGLHLTHAKLLQAPPEMTPLPHIFHPHHKQAAMDPGLPGHSPHSVGRSAWSGLNVGYEMQDPNKPGISGIAGNSKDHMSNLGPMPPTLRNKKRAAMATSVVSMASAPIMQNIPNLRRGPQPTPPPFYQEAIKESPPSSPNSERPIKPKIEPRLTASAPHMLGNELNPESVAAARLQEQLSAELAAHAAGHHTGHDTYTPPPLINKAGPSTTTRTSAQSLDQLLERQWEQGSQFLMEQAQHFDIASLLSCLHQLRTENVRLEEHVGNLLQRRDHLLAVNARLAIPLTTVSGPGEPPRCQRDGGGPVRGPPGPVRPNETMTSDRSHQLMQRSMQQKPS